MGDYNKYEKLLPQGNAEEIMYGLSFSSWQISKYSV